MLKLRVAFKSIMASFGIFHNIMDPLPKILEKTIKKPLVWIFNPCASINLGVHLLEYWQTIYNFKYFLIESNLCLTIGE